MAENYYFMCFGVVPETMSGADKTYVMHFFDPVSKQRKEQTTTDWNDVLNYSRGYTSDRQTHIDFLTTLYHEKVQDGMDIALRNYSNDAAGKGFVEGQLVELIDGKPKWKSADDYLVQKYNIVKESTKNPVPRGTMGRYKWGKTYTFGPVVGIVVEEYDSNGDKHSATFNTTLQNVIARPSNDEYLDMMALASAEAERFVNAMIAQIRKSSEVLKLPIVDIDEI